MSDEITLAVLTTDGRRDCIEATIASAEENLRGRFHDRVIFTDSDPDYQRWLNARFPGWWVQSTGEKRGYAAAMRQAFMRLDAAPGPVFWLEDDFTFNRPVDLAAMAEALAGNPNLAQIVLRRQAWNPEERAAGGVVELHPDWYADVVLRGGHPALVHTAYWSDNPCLIAPWVFDVAFPESEGLFTFVLKTGRPDVGFAYWGARSDDPWVHHIGDVRVGAAY